MRLNVPRSQCRDGKVFEIESHNDFAPPTDSGGEDMAIFGVICDTGFDRLESFNAGFREVSNKLPSPVDDEILRRAEFSERTVGFIENPFTPVGKKEPGCLGQTKEQVSHPLVGEHVGIE